MYLMFVLGRCRSGLVTCVPAIDLGAPVLGQCFRILRAGGQAFLTEALESGEFIRLDGALALESSLNERSKERPEDSDGCGDGFHGSRNSTPQALRRDATTAPGRGCDRAPSGGA